MTSRREFVVTTAASALGLALPSPFRAGMTAGAPPRGFIDLLRAPDGVFALTTGGETRLPGAGDDRWSNEGVVVKTTGRAGALNVELSSPATAVKRLPLRWRGDLRDARLILGDAWERGYGD